MLRVVRAEDLLGPDVLCPRYLPEHTHERVGALAEDLEVLAVEWERWAPPSDPR